MTDLHSKGHHGDLGPSSISALEALDVARTLGYFPLHLGSVDHVSHGVINFGIGKKSRISETSNGGFGILDSPFSDHPPRRGRTKVTDGEERRQPDPLEDEGDSP
jgi:hypothetical protein